VCNFPYYFSAAVTDYQHLQNKPSSPERKPLPSIRCAGFVWRSRGAMAGGSIRAAAMVGGYRSATAVRRAVLRRRPSLRTLPRPPTGAARPRSRWTTGSFRTARRSTQCPPTRRPWKLRSTSGTLSRCAYSFASLLSFSCYFCPSLLF
jgi:hypothetical protein